MTIQKRFRKATLDEPYPVAIALAETLPDLRTIPSGVGKTAAVVLAWMDRSRFAEKTVRNPTPIGFGQGTLDPRTSFPTTGGR